VSAPTLRRELLGRAAPGIALLALGGLLLTGYAARTVAERDAQRWETQLERVSDSFAAADRTLRVLVTDYSLWDEMVDFVQSPSVRWARENLSPWLVEQHGIDFIAVVDREQRLVYVSDPTGTLKPGDTLADGFAVVHAQRHPATPFLWRTPGGAIWVAGAPIHPTLTPRYEAPGRGTFLAGYVLSPRFVSRLGAGAGVVTRLGSPAERPEPGSDGALALKTLQDAGGRPAATLLVERSGAAPGALGGSYWVLPAYFFASVLAGLLLLALAAERAVVGPLMALRRGVDELRRNRRLSRELPVDRTDEIGQLASEVAALAAELRDSEFNRHRSEGQLHALIDATPDDITVLDRQGRVLGLKRSAGDSSLLPRGVAVGDTLEQVCGSGLAAEVLALVEKTLDTGEMQLLECDTPGGELRRTWEGRIVPAGEAEVVAIWRDVTMRRRAEAARERLTAIVDATPDLVATAHVDGRLRYVNPATRRMLGLSADEPLESRNLADFAVPQHRRMIAEEALPAALRDGAWSGEMAVQGGGVEGEIPVSVVLLAHRVGDGEPSFLSVIARDISDRKRFEARLLHLADHDPLTDLLGRRRFGEELTRELAQSRRYSIEGALVFIDLDDFKFVNDSLGHAAGDELLIAIARLLQTRLRKTDALARLGGDEFAVLLPRAGRKQAEQVVSGLLDAMRLEAFSLGARRVNITASAGIVLFPEHGSEPAELLARADIAMYQAKSRGRNAHCLFEPDQNWQARVDSKLHGEQRIREALESDRLMLYAQPLLDLKSNRIEEFELLLRMRDEEGRIVRPGAFLGVAERFGLIHAIDRWVVREAIRLLAVERSDGRLVRASVNLSGRAFEDRELPGLIRAELLSRGMTASALAFEVTESAAIADTALAEAFAASLEELGCRLALDDFGVGFSSLYYLKKLPVAVLKIDGSFVRDIARNPVDVHLVRAIVEVGKALRKDTVAEYVADAATLELVAECGVDYAQGYYVGRPGPAAEVFRLFGHVGPAPLSQEAD